MFKKHRFIFALIAIILLGSFLRTFNINWGLDKEQPYVTEHEDEPYGYASAFQIKPLSGKLDPGLWAMQKGTFYYEIVGTINNILESSSLKKLIFPTTNTKGKEFYYNMILARGINVIFSIGNMILLYLLCILLFKKPVIGLLAALNYSIFAHEIAFNNIVAGDIAASFFTLGTIYFSLKAYKQNQPKTLFLAGLFSGFTTATKFTGIFTTIPVAISFFLIKKQGSITNRLKTVGKTIAAFLLGFIIGMPSIIFNFSGFLEGLKTLKYYQTGDFLPGEDQLPRFIYYFTNVFNNGLGLIFTVLIVVGIIYFTYSRKKEKDTYIILSWIIPYYIILSLSSWITHRYTMPLMPLFTLIIAYFIYGIYKNFKNKTVSLLLITALYAYNLLFLYNFMGMTHQTEARAQFYQYEEEKLKLDKKNPEMTFIVLRIENTSHPTGIDYPVDVLFIKTIQENPQIEITTKYILVADSQIRDHLRLKDPAVTDFFKNLEKKYKLIKTFKKDPPLDFFYDDSTYFASDLELFMKKYYLYERKTD